MSITELIPIIFTIFIFLVIVTVIISLIAIAKKNLNRKESNIDINGRIERLEKEMEDIKGKLD